MSAPKARRRERRSLPVAVPTRWTPELLEGIAAGERRALAPLLEDPASHAAAIAANERADVLLAAALAKEPPPIPIACGPACPSCCVSKVGVVAPEVLRIARFLRETLDAPSLERLASRVRATDDLTRGLSRPERARRGIPCPLLVDGSCGVHPVRPLLCKGWTSLDASACRRHFDDPERVPVAPAYSVGYELASAVLAGLGAACADQGRDGALLELVAALRIALDQPNAGEHPDQLAERWAMGRPVFAPARDGHR